MNSWLDSVDSHEFFCWFDFYLDNPGLFDDPWIMDGQICATVGNAARTKRSDPKFDGEDFIPRWRPPLTEEEQQTLHQLIKAEQQAVRRHREKQREKRSKKHK